jgi:hypothetical protein
MPLDLNKARKCLADFDFPKLFVEELGWSQPSSRQAVSMTLRRGTGVSPVIHGRDGHVTKEHGLDTHATDLHHLGNREILE